MAINAIRNAAIEFCSYSYYWQELQDAVDVTSADLPYSLVGTAESQVIQILDCIVNGNSINPLSVDGLDTNFTNWREQEGTGILGYYQPNPTKVSFYPLPTDSISVRLRVAYAPLRASSEIEQYVYEGCLEAIAAGALGRLLAIPKQVWSDEKLAEFYQSKFNNGKVRARIDAEKSFGRVSMQVQPRAFG